MMMGMRVLLMLVGLMAVGSVCFGSDDVGGVGGSLTLEEAIMRVDGAIDRAGVDGGDEDIFEAAAVLGFVLDRDGIKTSGGEVTLGNAYFAGGDLGRAIVHYRRGLMIDPADEVLQENLAHARSFVEPRVPGDGEGWTVRGVLLSWHGVMDRWVLWYGVVGAFGIASVLGTVRMVGGLKRVGALVPIGFGFLGLVGAGLLGFDQWVMELERGVVVVLPGVGLYSGPGVGVYQEVYDGALGIGTEGEVLEFRDGWARVRLGNTQEGWAELDSFVFVGSGLDS